MSKYCHNCDEKISDDIEIYCRGCKQIVLLKGKVELANNQFQSILNASPESWDMTREEFKEEFHLWLKNRAQYILEKLK